MNGIRVLAIVLIIAGILGLVYGGFSYTIKTHRTDIGPIELAVREKNTVSVPVWAGIGAIAAGSGLLFIRKKR